MASSTQSVFRNSALLSGLVTQEELDCGEVDVREAMEMDATAEVSDEQLAEQLVEKEVITTYQADQLRFGRTKLNLGPYIVTDWIGQGGMGQVFKAEHKVMGRECAVKVLPLNKSTPEAIANFSREIRTQAKLDHPNLVRAHDAGHEGKVHFFVTEYVPGMDLRKLIRSQQGPLSMQQAACVIMQAAQALEYAHECGLIHRDVKPGNILVTPEGVAKVSDLGLAGCVTDNEEDPRAGKIVGTADYLSPEQIRNPHETRKVSDIYSLGCTLYYAITGKVPFPGGTPASKARRHLEETPWHPRRFNQDVSEEFVEIIADMMEKDPDERIQTAAEVATRLEPWAVDAGPIVSRHLTKSPWTAPPLPTGAEETDVASTDQEDGDSVRQESFSQGSQGTDPFWSLGQETQRMGGVRRPPLPPPLPAIRKKQRRLIIALVVAIPAALAVGVWLGFWLRPVWG
ncbi:MAG: serine/threonine-protein kinase [Pirellulaceae bacterium]